MYFKCKYFNGYEWIHKQFETYDELESYCLDLVQKWYLKDSKFHFRLYVNQTKLFMTLLSLEMLSKIKHRWVWYYD